MTWNQDSYYYNVELHFTPNTTLYSIRFRTPNAYVEDAPFVIDGIKYTPRLSGSTEKMLAESFVANRVIIANIDRLLNIITFESGNGSGGSSRVPDIFGDGSDGELIVRSGQNLILPVPVPDQSIIEKNYSSILIEAGGTLSCASRNAGLILRCQGDCTIQGTIDQSLKSPKTNPNNNYQYPPELICGDGGDGGSSSTNSYGGIGGRGMTGRPYGGGWSGGGAGYSGGHYSSGGAAMYGGHGGSVDNLTVDVPDNQLFVGGNGGGSDPISRGGDGLNGGGGGGGGARGGGSYAGGGRGASGAGSKGGDGRKATNASGGPGGGAGNIGGGVLLLYVGGDLLLEGTIDCHGGNGGDGGGEDPGSLVSNGQGMGAGGAGGGAIYIEYFNEIANTANIKVNGGKAGASNRHSPGAVPTAGTAGTVTIKKYVDKDK